jgi:hypothetical protein
MYACDSFRNGNQTPVTASDEATVRRRQSDFPNAMLYAADIAIHAKIHVKVLGRFRV